MGSNRVFSVSQVWQGTLQLHLRDRSLRLCGYLRSSQFNGCFGCLGWSYHQRAGLLSSTHGRPIGIQYPLLTAVSFLRFFPSVTNAIIIYRWEFLYYIRLTVFCCCIDDMVPAA